MEQHSVYYSPSNKMGPGGLIKLFSFAFLGILAVSAVTVFLKYALINWDEISDLMYMLLIGMAAGFFITHAAYDKKIRNKRLLMVTGFFTGLAGIYFFLVFNSFAASEFKTFELFSYTLISHYQEILVKIGNKPHVIVLYLLWVIEALFAIGLPIWCAFRFLRMNPFCETCNKWMDTKVTTSPFPEITDRMSFISLIQQLENGNSELLNTLKPDPSKMGNMLKRYSKIDVEFCSACPNLFLLSVSNRRVRADYVIESIETDNTDFIPILRQLIISPQVYNMIKTLECKKKTVEVAPIINQTTGFPRFKAISIKILKDLREILRGLIDLFKK